MTVTYAKFYITVISKAPIMYIIEFITTPCHWAQLVKGSDTLTKGTGFNLGVSQGVE